MRLEESTVEYVDLISADSIATSLWDEDEVVERISSLRRWRLRLRPGLASTTGSRCREDSLLVAAMLTRQGNCVTTCLLIAEACHVAAGAIKWQSAAWLLWYSAVPGGERIWRIFHDLFSGFDESSKSDVETATATAYQAGKIRKLSRIQTLKRRGCCFKHKAASTKQIAAHELM
jgi:hypothetical protein